MAIVAGGGKGDLAIVRRPARHRVFRRIAGQLADLAIAQVQHKDVVVAAQRIAAVGGKGDAGAVMAEDRFAVVEGAARQFALSRAIRRHRPEVITAIAIAEEDDALAVRRPGRLAGIIEEVGDAPGRTTRGRQHPDAALQVHGQPFAVG
jgi:stage III sporulation protein SpoIIIAA